VPANAAASFDPNHGVMLAGASKLLVAALER